MLRREEKIEVIEVTCIRNVCNIRKVTARNSFIRERCGCEINVAKRVERNVLKCLNMWKEWKGEKCLRVCIGRMCRVIGR